MSDFSARHGHPTAVADLSRYSPADPLEPGRVRIREETWPRPPSQPTSRPRYGRSRVDSSPGGSDAGGRLALGRPATAAASKTDQTDRDLKIVRNRSVAHGASVATRRVTTDQTGCVLRSARPQCICFIPTRTVVDLRKRGARWHRTHPLARQPSLHLERAGTNDQRSPGDNTLPRRPQRASTAPISAGVVTLCSERIATDEDAHRETPMAPTAAPSFAHKCASDRISLAKGARARGTAVGMARRVKHVPGSVALQSGSHTL
jgi:hypothetical protein